MVSPRQITTGTETSVVFLSVGFGFNMVLHRFFPNHEVAMSVGLPERNVLDLEPGAIWQPLLNPFTRLHPRLKRNYEAVLAHPLTEEFAVHPDVRAHIPHYISGFHSPHQRFVDMLLVHGPDGPK